MLHGNRCLLFFRFRDRCRAAPGSSRFLWSTDIRVRIFGRLRFRLALEQLLKPLHQLPNMALIAHDSQMLIVHGFSVQPAVARDSSQVHELALPQV